MPLLVIFPLGERIGKENFQTFCSKKLRRRDRNVLFGSPYILLSFLNKRSLPLKPNTTVVFFYVCVIESSSIFSPVVFFGLRFMSITVVLDSEPFSSFLILLTLLQPAKREAYSQADGFKPVERELIFDIVSEFQFSLL